MRNAKYEQGLEIAFFARGVVEPEVSEWEMRSWTADELYLWLSSWDYVWNGERWTGMQHVWLAVREEREWRQCLLGVYSTEEAAKSACVNGYDCYARMTLDVAGEELEFVYPNGRGRE